MLYVEYWSSFNQLAELEFKLKIIKQKKTIFILFSVFTNSFNKKYSISYTYNNFEFNKFNIFFLKTQQNLQFYC